MVLVKGLVTEYLVLSTPPPGSLMHVLADLQIIWQTAFQPP